ncbi:hypothetical protein WMY93_000674 [Mugilogobius chulae]|uniref:Uncharacterized protein n=1 Tax=Mugilogobius chulae TaxID=88201 RepID=A0AAW0PZZ5_9GOBI
MIRLIRRVLIARNNQEQQEPCGTQISQSLSTRQSTESQVQSNTSSETRPFEVLKSTHSEEEPQEALLEEKTIRLRLSSIEKQLSQLPFEVQLPNEERHTLVQLDQRIQSNTSPQIRASEVPNPSHSKEESQEALLKETQIRHELPCEAQLQDKQRQTTDYLDQNQDHDEWDTPPPQRKEMRPTRIQQAAQSPAQCLYGEMWMNKHWNDLIYEVTRRVMRSKNKFEIERLSEELLQGSSFRYLSGTLRSKSWVYYTVQYDTTYKDIILKTIQQHLETPKRRTLGSVLRSVCSALCCWN